MFIITFINFFTVFFLGFIQVLNSTPLMKEWTIRISISLQDYGALLIYFSSYIIFMAVMTAVFIVPLLLLISIRAKRIKKEKDIDEAISK